MNKQKEITLIAVNKGYRISFDGCVYNPKGIKLNGTVNIKGYKKFGLKNKNSEDHPIYYHRLQAYQKFGDKIFEKGIMVRHLDGNPLNNSYDNIEIGTNSDNQMDRSPECRKRTSINASRKMQDRTRSYEERCIIYEKLRIGIPYKTIEKENNINRGTLSFMKNKSIEYKEYLDRCDNTDTTITSLLHE